MASLGCQGSTFGSGFDPACLDTLPTIDVNASRIFPDVPTFQPPLALAPFIPKPFPVAELPKTTPARAPPRPAPVPRAPISPYAPKPVLPGGLTQPATLQDVGITPTTLEEVLGAVPPELSPEAGQLAKNTVWQALTSFGGAAVGTFLDFVTLALYSPALGPSAQEEAALVAQTIASAEPNPFYNPDYQPDPYAEPLYVAPVVAPDTQGLPQPDIQPALQPLTVTATRLGTTPAALNLLDLATVPGIAFNLGSALAPGLVRAVSPATVIAAPAPTVGVGTFASVGNALSPGILQSVTPGVVGGIEAALAPELPGPAPGETGMPASSQDCTPTKPKPEDQKKKKQQKKKRTVCYRGVYYERASGLTKFRREQIPCR